MSAIAPDPHTRVSALFQCLASPVRTRLIEQLLDRSACVHELVDALGLPQPLISQHLRVLRSHDLVSCTRRGREVLYQLDDEHVARIVRDALAHACESADHVGGDRHDGGDGHDGDPATLVVVPAHDHHPEDS